MFISLTDFDSGRTQWVNVAHISGFERSEDGFATSVRLVDQVCGSVKETPEQILAKMTQ